MLVEKTSLAGVQNESLETDFVTDNRKMYKPLQPQPMVR